MSLKLETISDQSGFEKLAPEWSALLGRSESNCLFLSWEWLYTWWKHMGGARKLAILLVRDEDGRLEAIAPLALRPAELVGLRPFRAIEFLGTGYVGSDYLDLIVGGTRAREASALLGQALSNRKLMAEFTHVRSESFAAEALAAQLVSLGWRAARIGINICPYIDIARHTSWDSYLDSLGPKHRYNFRRRLRNLSREYDVRLRTVASETERRKALEALIGLHNARWAERGGSTAFHRSELIAFHHEFSRIALERRWLRLYSLTLDGAPAAFLYGFRYGRVFYFYQSAFDARFARHSVGLVTMGLAIRTAIEEGAAEYDLLHGDEAYKSWWTEQSRPLFRVSLYPPTAGGAVSRRLTGLRQAAGKMARRVL